MLWKYLCIVDALRELTLQRMTARIFKHFGIVGLEFEHCRQEQDDKVNNTRKFNKLRIW